MTLNTLRASYRTFCCGCSIKLISNFDTNFLRVKSINILCTNCNRKLAEYSINYCVERTTQRSTFKDQFFDYVGTRKGMDRTGKSNQKLNHILNQYNHVN